MKYLKIKSISLALSIFLMSCGGNKTTMQEVASYLKNNKYYGELKRDSTFVENPESKYSEVYFYGNLTSVFKEMKQYGYFIGKKAEIQFEMNRDFGRICGYGLFNPFSLVIGKKKTSSKAPWANTFAQPDETYEGEIFHINMNTGNYKYTSSICNDSIKQVFKKMNEELNNGKFIVNNDTTKPNEKIDSTFLIGKPYEIWEQQDIPNTPLNFSYQLIQTQNGYLWVEANTFTKVYAGWDTNPLSHASLGFSFYFFDNNGFYKWNKEVVKTLGDDRSTIEGYKINSDTILLFVQHTAKTRDKYNTSSENYEYYVLKLNLKEGAIISHITLAKHFAKEYREQYEIQNIEGVQESLDLYYTKDDELSQEDKSLIDTFTPIKFNNQFSEGTEKFDFQYETKSNDGTPSNFKMLKNGNDILKLSQAPDKYFYQFKSLNYSSEKKQIAGIASAKNFWGFNFEYIRVIDLNGNIKPIILKHPH